MLKTYGLTIKLDDVKKVASELMANLPAGKLPHTTIYMPVYYDKETGEVWSKYFNDFGGSKTVYRDDDIINVNVYRQSATAQEIIDDIYANLTFGNDFYNYDEYWDWKRGRNA